MTEGLIVNHYEAVAVILSGIGLTNLLLQRNLIKKIIGLNIMDTAVYLFLAAKGYVAGLAAPGTPLRASTSRSGWRAGAVPTGRSPSRRWVRRSSGCGRGGSSSPA